MTHALAQAAGGLFTVPAIAAVGALAVSVPIVIHLMSRFRRRPEPWGAMRFLMEAYKKQRKRLQLERLLLLLVRCLLVLIAGLALAGPVLSGCGAAGGLGGFLTGQSSGRVVYIVVDDALSTQTREAGGTRLDRLKQEALGVVDALEEGDRAVVVRMGRPPLVVTDSPTPDKDALREAVTNISPRYGRSDLSAALVRINNLMDEQNVRDGHGVVVLLSDFARSSAYLDEALPPELAGLGDRAAIVTALPAQGTDNVQVVSVTPRRRMVVASGGGATSISTEVRLRRFGGETLARSQTLRVTLNDAQGVTVAEAMRTARWLAGQRETVVNLDLPAALDADATRGGRELVVVAQLTAANAEAGVDALPADDRAVAVVRLRERLQVALVDDGSRVNDEPGALQPWQWARAALSPMGGGGSAGGPFEVTALTPTAVNEATLASVDAAVVLRPDQLTPGGWEALQTFAQQGGLVWVFTPAVEDQSRWPLTLVRVFELPWEVGDALVETPSAEDEAGAEPAALDASVRAPSVLQYLAADWREKLGWVSVSRRLPMSTPDEDRWMAVDTARPGLAGADRPVLLAGRAVGSGTVLLMGTAPDARFTNLVVRPLFAPLVHDTLRGVLGDAGRLTPIVAGDRPDLGRAWRNTGELVWSPAFSADDSEVEPPSPVMIQTDGDHAATGHAFVRPGIYAGGAGAGQPRLLAVNVDAIAGDTYPAQPRLEQWLDKLGGWSYLEDKRDAGGVLATGARLRDLTWPLLWAVLGLVLLETWLARVFSHATDRDRPTVVGRALGALSGGGGAASTSAAADETTGRAA
ncbi:MAG: BatA domain-containing protein [Phycisphaerales bacterium JB063]